MGSAAESASFRWSARTFAIFLGICCRAPCIAAVTFATHSSSDIELRATLYCDSHNVSAMTPKPCKLSLCCHFKSLHETVHATSQERQAWDCHKVSINSKWLLMLTSKVPNTAPDVDAGASCVKHVGCLACARNLVPPVLFGEVDWDGLLLFLVEVPACNTQALQTIWLDMCTPWQPQSMFLQG